MEAIKDMPLHYKSKSGSSYYFTKDGVYRLSDHWGRAANCRWRLSGGSNFEGKLKLGFAKWIDFHPDNDAEKLYFIEVGPDGQTVQFFHKGSGNYTPEVVLRTAPDTMKRIRQIRQLFAQTAWSDYLTGDVGELRSAIIQKLIATNQTFQQIRKEYL